MMEATEQKFHHILKRVDRPFGYWMEPEKLPDWIHYTITRTDDSQFVTVHSRLHVDKEVRLSHCYSLDYPLVDIIKDVSPIISRRFL